MPNSVLPEDEGTRAFLLVIGLFLAFGVLMAAIFAPLDALNKPQVVHRHTIEVQTEKLVTVESHCAEQANNLFRKNNSSHERANAAAWAVGCADRMRVEYGDQEE